MNHESIKQEVSNEKTFHKTLHDIGQFLDTIPVIYTVAHRMDWLYGPDGRWPHVSWRELRGPLGISALIAIGFLIIAVVINDIVDGTNLMSYFHRIADIILKVKL